MTPKEKAIELVNRFKGFEMTNENYAIKQVAIIVVDEILKNFIGLHKPEYCAFDAIGERKFTFEGEYDEHMTGYDMEAYWNEVKEEINKL